MRFKCGPLLHNIAYSTVLTEAEYKLKWQITYYTPYLTLMGELWGVFCEGIYNGTTLYCIVFHPYFDMHFGIDRSLVCAFGTCKTMLLVNIPEAVIFIIPLGQYICLKNSYQTYIIK